MKKIVFLFFSLLISVSIFSEKKKIKLIRAEDLKSAKEKFNNAQRLITNVRLKQEDVILDCDSAHLFKSENVVKLYDNLHIKKGDSIDVYAQYGELEGNTKYLKLRNNVIIIKKDKATLYSDSVDFDLKKNLATYFQGGKIISAKDTIISDQAYLFTKKDSVELIDNVKIYGEKFSAFSDYINYQMKKDVVKFRTPTEIFYQDSYLYSERGTYYNKTQSVDLLLNNKLIHQKRIVIADTIYGDGVDSTVFAYSNVEINDTVNKLKLQSDYTYLDNKKKESYTTKNVLGINYGDAKDTLFFTCDTIHTIYDSTKTFNNLYAYNNILMYKDNMQANCDSLYYNFKDSIMSLYNNPVLWFENNQLRSKEVRVHLKNKKLDSVDLLNKAYIFTKNNEFDYNQIKGNDIYLKLKKGKINYADVKENAESIYYLQKKKGGKMMGINRANSKDMHVEFKKGKLYKINLKTNPKSNITPMKLVTDKDSRMKEFEWLDHLRPKDKYFNFKEKK